MGRPPDPVVGRITGRRADERAVSPAVGVAVLIGLAAVLAAGVGVAAVGLVPSDPVPQVGVSVTADATDGWPDGQRLVVTHEGGASVPVSELAVAVALPESDRRARLSGFPTRRLTGENVRGDDVFDAGYAGVDGAVDAAHTDGQWDAGERLAFRIAQHEYDLRQGERVRIRIVHEPTDRTLAISGVIAR
jgi:FlaG/FlaF family flagellin (archaellin)